MATRRWTIVVVPHGGAESRSLSVSDIALRVLLSAATLVGILALAFGYATVTRAVNLTRLDRLERRNEVLAQELQLAQTQLAALGDTLSTIAERDRRVRLLAGLDPTDPSVQLAGVGGPANAWTAREEILSEGIEGREALGLRRDLDDYIRRANLLAASFGEALDSMQRHVDRLERTPSISPVSRQVGWFTSPFARIRMHPIYAEPRPHSGVDVSAPLGTPILAPAAGRVVEVRIVAGYGRTVTIDHGYGVQTFYAHCAKILVRAGQMVRRNEEIAEVGMTGVATGPHLHYEVLVGGQPVNPSNYIFPDTIVD